MEPLQQKQKTLPICFTQLSDAVKYYYIETETLGSISVLDSLSNSIYANKTFLKISNKLKIRYLFFFRRL